MRKKNIKFDQQSKNLKRNKKILTIYFILLSLLVIFTNGADLIHKFNWSELFGTIFYFIFVGLCLFVPPTFYHKLSAYISFHISKVCMPGTFSIDEYGVTSKGRFFPKSKVRWSTFSKFIVAENRVLLVRKFMPYPMFALITFLPKRSMKENDWEKFVAYIKYKDELLANIKQPNRIIRWSIRILFVILIELCLLTVMSGISLLLKSEVSTPLISSTVILAIFLPLYSAWIDFKKYTVKKNLLFPLGALILLILLFGGLVLWE